MKKKKIRKLKLKKETLALLSDGALAWVRGGDPSDACGIGVTTVDMTPAPTALSECQNCY